MRVGCQHGLHQGAPVVASSLVPPAQPTASARSTRSPPRAATGRIWGAYRMLGSLAEAAVASWQDAPYFTDAKRKPGVAS
ncbi:hypothetical protein ABZ801_20130 [Actinomadura sp. NPDC047616]|uniref:hypothetical protein n=1 Tax=Actinomadura sp. NPDC047616 TaxID=3155914 RepID=UPI0033C15C68